MDQPDTHLVRTKNGRMVHKRGCSYAGWGKPWVWAEGKGHHQIALSVISLGVNFCKRCEPLVGLPADNEDHQPSYEGIDNDFVVVRCLCRDFYRICESREVAEAEYRNHVDLSRPGGDASVSLTWTRVMDGEYKVETLTGWWYYVDYISEGCTRCAHSHDYWQLSGSAGGKAGKLGEFRTMRDAKAAAEVHAEAVAGGESLMPQRIQRDPRGAELANRGNN